MQILLQALFAESTGKTPEIADTVKTVEQGLFGDLFFSEQGAESLPESSLVFGEVFVPPETLEKAIEPPLSSKIEVFLPTTGPLGGQTGKRFADSMIDITPDDLAPIAPGSSEQFPLDVVSEETPVQPHVAPIPIALPVTEPAPKSDARRIPDQPKAVIPASTQILQHAAKPEAFVADTTPHLPRATPDQLQEKPIDAPAPALRIIPVAKAENASGNVIQRKTAELSEEAQKLKLAALPEGTSQAGETVLSRQEPPMQSQPTTNYHLGEKRESQSSEVKAIAEDVVRPKIKSHPQPSAPSVQSTNANAQQFQTRAFDMKREQGVSLDPATGLKSLETSESRPHTPAVARAETAAARPIVNQVIQMIARANLDGMIEVRLQPEELGRVRLAMTQIDAGVTVHITAERQETLELLRRNIDILESDLRGQGFDNASFTFGQDGASMSRRDEDEAYDGSEALTTPKLQVNVISEPLIGDDGRLDIRL